MIIGLTGGIGSGKTTVANLFAQLGIECIDADIIAREVVVPGAAALKVIQQQFGKEVLLASGELNRTVLRQMIFSNEKNKQWLENLLHPLILAEIAKRIKSIASPYGIVTIPLLFETGPYDFISRTLLVDALPEQQIARIMQRDGLTAEQAKNIIGQQMAREQRINQADDIILNDGEQGSLAKKVHKLHEKYLLLA